MKILDTIAAAMKGKKAPTAAVLADLLAQTKAETEAARARLLDLETRRPEMALAGEGERLSFRADLTLARDDVAEGEAAIGALTGKHEAALAAEAEADRNKTYKAAKLAASELTDLIGEYDKHAQAVRDVIARIAVIDGVVAKANSDLPADAAPLAGSRTLRSVPALPSEIVSEKAVDLWVREGRNEPAIESLQHTVVVQPNGRGWHHPRNSPHPEWYDKRRFIRREMRAGGASVHAIDLAEVNLPAAFAAKPKAERAITVSFIPVKDAT